MKEKLLSMFSVVSAMFAALCWGGGIILSSLGLGTIGTAYFSTLTKYKPLFVVITAVMLYWSYSIIEKKGSNKRMIMLFWILALASILIIYYPTILRLFM